MARVRGRIASALLGIVALAGCAPAPPPPTPRVIVLGIDGFSPNLLVSMLARQQLPNFNRLALEGRIGRVSTADTGLPPFSPRIWTSFATGVLPRAHGIAGFVKVQGANRQLFSSEDRRVPAVWEIASAAGQRVGVVNWPVTYPAETVNGFMISERWLPSTAPVRNERFGAIAPEGLVYPTDLLPKLAALDIHAATRPARLPAEAEKDDRDVLRMAWTSVAMHPVDMLLVYTNGVDAMQHLTWHTHELLPGEPKPGEDLVEALAVRWDGLLGEVMAQLTPVDHLIVISDHGAERNKKPGLPGTHESAAAALGILLLWGPRIQPGPVAATTLDIAPTILELAGIPPSAAMPGKVLDCVVPAGTKPLPRRQEPYLRTPRARPAPTDAGAVDETIRERLKELGYLDE